MCEIKAYVYEDGKEELYLENVDTITPAKGADGEDVLRLRSLFGEEKTFKGTIKELNLRKNRVVLQR